ncbi:hypothetical protein N9850_01210 [Granulosicoccus sp.]|nr:hypothetical protein [Granulosicoccus sp.]MDB4222361.1 hypothetical protein [Granulosicoccus sp.]
MLDHSQALVALIAHVNASDKPVSLSWDEVQQWQDGVLAQFLAIGFLSTDVKAQSLVCMGCQQQCFMPVYQTDDGRRAFIVCDDPDMQTQMGRVKVPLERLQQWHASARQFAGVVAGLLGFDTKQEFQKTAASYRLGMLNSEGGRRWVSISVQPLGVEINRRSVPLTDLLYYSEDVLVLDQPRIDELLNSITSDSRKPYTPIVSKRETRKLTTQAMYQDWHDEYLSLQRKHPHKSNTWYSLQISKLPIAQGKDSETIRKNMKK